VDIDKGLISLLDNKSIEVRKNIVRMIYSGGSGHPGGSLSCADILVSLYFHIMHIDPGKPGLNERDRLVLSKAHAAPALYSVLAERGYFDRNLLDTFSHNGSRLQKHIDMHLLPGIEISGGSLGQGLSIAAGMALTAKLDDLGCRIYVVIGDGESQEGQLWEAAMTASHYKLGNITVFLDKNRLQVDGTTDEVMSIDPVEDKWKSFGWNTLRINGHDHFQIINGVRKLQVSENTPGILIADTVKGKGVSFSENKVEWHARTFTEEELDIAINELEEKQRSL
jgi:transketolase